MEEVKHRVKALPPLEEFKSETRPEPFGLYTKARQDSENSFTIVHKLIAQKNIKCSLTEKKSSRYSDVNVWRNLPRHF